MYYFMCNTFYIIRHLLWSGEGGGGEGGCSCPSSDGSDRSDDGFARGGIAGDGISNP
jgi:hypothetical protein